MEQGRGGAQEQARVVVLRVVEHLGGRALLDGLASRLRPGGRLVVAAVLLGSLETARRALSRPDLRLAMTQVQASQAVPLAGDWHLRADNPVWLLTAIKEAHA